MAGKNGGEKLGAVGAQVALLIQTTAAWRTEVRADIAGLRAEVVQRMDKHELVDDNHHAQVSERVNRLETQSLEAGKMLVERVDDVEKKIAATTAVEQYRKWIIGIGVALAANVVFNVISYIRPLIR